MYAVVKALLATIADAQSDNPLVTVMLRGFPFHMMRYGHGGVAAIGSTCGAFNGAAAVIGLFIHDADKRDAMIQELAGYYEQTELPIYKPKDDMFPSMDSVASESVLCHISCGRWLAVTGVKISSPRRKDRCRRLTADIAAKTAELLNRYHADNTCTFAPLTQPTATCVDCHGPQGTQADASVKMDCAVCHEHDESHNNQYLNMQK